MLDKICKTELKKTLELWILRLQKPNSQLEVEKFGAQSIREPLVGTQQGNQNRGLRRNSKVC